jgi:predicted PurR-regulated permease PerM
VTPSRRPTGYIRGVGTNLVMRLIGLLTTLLVLGAVYLFIVKPVLDTTNNAFDSVNDTVNNAFEDSGLNGVNFNDLENGNFDDVQKQIQQAGLDSQQQQNAEKLLHCVQRVQPDTTKMQACAERFG